MAEEPQAQGVSSWERLRNVVGWVAVVSWCGSIVLDAVLGRYDPPATVHVLMLTVAGALFGPRIAGRKNGNGSH